MTNKSIEALLREIASRGELVHISIVAVDKQFEAKFSPATSMGYVSCLHEDPVVALEGALTKIRLLGRKPRTTGEHVDGPEPEPVTDTVTRTAPAVLPSDFTPDADAGGENHA
jgi:hypothetical protein